MQARAATLAVTSPAPAHADTRNVATVVDPTGDVALTTRTRLTRAEKKSIDLRRVSVQRVDNQARFIVAIRDVMRVQKFDQAFFIRMREHPHAPGGAWAGDVGFTSKGRYSYAYYGDDSGYGGTNCNVAVTTRPVRNEIVATVPWRCVPEGPLRISVESLTGHFRSDAPLYSRDRATFAGWPTILPN